MFVVAFEVPESVSVLKFCVIGVGKSKEEAEEIVCRYAIKVLRSKYEWTDTLTDFNDNAVYIWEDEYGLDRFMITEVQNVRSNRRKFS